MAASSNTLEPTLSQFKSASSNGELTVYTGISNRARGLETKKITKDLMEGQISDTHIKRWDGNAKACASWDSLSQVSTLPCTSG
jgi:hypothetical protein